MPPQSQVIPAPADLERTDADGGKTAPPVIRASQLGKRFKIYPRPSGRIVEWITGGRAVRHEEFWALRDVSLSVARGEAVGVIGVNGSGKSTLLKILSGAMYPTTGTFEINGRVLSLLELGTGLNPELTGRENVVNSARLLAFPPGYVEGKIEEIASFADLGEFFDKPVRLYSSGMVVRLAFGTFACLEPDVFIVDEALSVGDVFFQQKCVKRLEAMREAGTTMLFVSHDMQLVRRLCRRAVLLRHGRVAFEGEPDEAVARYFSLMGSAAPQAEDPHPNPLPECREREQGDSDWSAHDILHGGRSRHGPRNLEVSVATFQDARGRHALALRQGETATVRLLLRANKPFPRPTCGIHLFDRLGNLVFAAGTAQLRRTLPGMAAGEQRAVTFRITFSVQPGEYTFSLGCSAEPDESRPDVSPLEDQHEGLGPLTVYPPAAGEPYFYGIAKLPMEVEF